MTETRKPSQGKKKDAESQASEQDTRAEGTSTPAIRHVGPTLESDPHYFDVDREGGGLTPEAQIANVGAAPDTTMGRGGTDPSADVSGRFDSPDAGTGRPAPERLKTRLPGDTSSDPHTDLGTENATSVQRRGDRRD